MMASTGKLSISEVADIVECEGLGYAISDYMAADQIGDPRLRDLWELAAGILAEIEAIIGTETD
jgi:hypothetical protein